jgi:arylsulfatase A-like enzyme
MITFFGKGTKMKALKQILRILQDGRKMFLGLLAGSAAVNSLPMLPEAKAATEDPPNVIFILADDLGWTDISCHEVEEVGGELQYKLANGNRIAPTSAETYDSTFYETPNLAKLRKDAMRFTSAYCPWPLCNPTRASILTGQYPQHMGIMRNKEPFLPTETTIADALKSANEQYYCGMFGKWHTKKPGDYETYKTYYDTYFDPDDYGFDESADGDFYGNNGNYHSPLQYYEGRAMSGYWEHFDWGEDEPEIYDGWGPNHFKDLDNPVPGDDYEFLTDSLTTRAIEFIKDANSLQRPFFLYLSYHAVHTPIDCPKEDAEHFKNSLGLEAQWKFDEDLGDFEDYYPKKATHDSSGNGRDLTASGTEYDYVEGTVLRFISADQGTGYNSREPGKAAEFGGDNYFYADNYQGISGSSARIVCAWVKGPDKGSIGGTIVSWGGTGTGESWILRIVSDQGAKVQLAIDDQGNHIQTTNSLNTFDDVNGWYHITAVLEENQTTLAGATIYITGEEADTSSNQEEIDTDNELDVTVGAFNGSGYFKGYIDEVRIYSRALSSKQITDIRHQRLHENMYYAGMIRRVDYNVGRVMTELDNLEIEDNTIVMFFSDNGARNWVYLDPEKEDQTLFIGHGDPPDPCSLTYYDYPTSNYPLTSSKHNIYEGGIRVPLLIKWPGETSENSTCTIPVSAIDFLPTIYEMAFGEGSMKSASFDGVDGVSLFSVLKDPDTCPSSLKRNLFSQDWDGNIAVICNDGSDYDGYKLVERKYAYNNYPNELYKFPVNMFSTDTDDLIENPDHSHDPLADNYDPDDPDPESHNDLFGDPDHQNAKQHLLTILDDFKKQMPVLHLKLDEFVGVKAFDCGALYGDDRYRNNGKLEGAPQWQPTGGQINGALDFDGEDDYVICPFVLNPNDGPFSAFAWVKGGDSSQHIICQLDENGTGRLWFHVNADNHFSTQLREPGGSGLAYTDETWDSQNWHHVGIVWDGLRRHLYIDGEEVIADKPALAGLEDCDGGLHIGVNKDLIYTYSHWDGLVDDVRIYDRALGAEEIAELAGAPVAHWKLDETEGTIAYDSSVNNYDGTLCDDFPTDDSQWVTGWINGALEFDGEDDYVICPFVLNPNDGPFSAFAWVKNNGNGVQDRVLSQSGGRLWLHANYNGDLTTQLREVGGSGLSSDKYIVDGYWYHVGIVWDGSYRRLFVHGDEVAADPEENPIGPLESCAGYTYIGTSPDLDPNYDWDGLIDDVRIYDRALSEAEIENLAGM